jgi:hypothetical protein
MKEPTNFAARVLTMLDTLQDEQKEILAAIATLREKVSTIEKNVEDVKNHVLPTQAVELNSIKTYIEVQKGRLALLTYIPTAISLGLAILHFVKA